MNKWYRLHLVTDEGCCDLKVTDIELLDNQDIDGEDPGTPCIYFNKSDETVMSIPIIECDGEIGDTFTVLLNADDFVNLKVEAGGKPLYLSPL